MSPTSLLKNLDIRQRGTLRVLKLTKSREPYYLRVFPSKLIEGAIRWRLLSKQGISTMRNIAGKTINLID